MTLGVVGDGKEILGQGIAKMLSTIKDLFLFSHFSLFSSPLLSCLLSIFPLLPMTICCFLTSNIFRLDPSVKCKEEYEHRFT